MFSQAASTICYSINPILDISPVHQPAHPFFSNDYLQALTHGDFSPANILVHETILANTGVIDWTTLATVLPCGLELSCLYLITWYMDLHGWHNYACQARLQDAYWDEFWSATGVDGPPWQVKVRYIAEQAAAMGDILRHGFQCNADGSPSKVLATSEAWTWKYLQAWLST